MTGTPEYEQGLRDGKLISLEASVKELTRDVKQLKTGLWMLYGALALVQFLPLLKGLFVHGVN